MKKARGITSLVIIVFILVLTPFMQGGCGSSGGGGGDDPGPNPPSPKNNLALTSIEVLDTDTLQIGHPVRIKVGISADLDTENVSANFFIINKEEYDAAQNDESPQDVAYQTVGATNFEAVSAGNENYDAEILIPYTSPYYTNSTNNNGEPLIDWDPVERGTYYLFAEIDPAELIEEKDEKDNRPTESNIHQTMITVEVDDEYKTVPNIVLEKVIVEIPSFEVPEAKPDSCGNIPDPSGTTIDDMMNSHIGVTAVLNSSGSYWVDGRPGPIPRLDVSASITHPALSKDIQMKIWNPGADPDCTDLGNPLCKPFQNTLSIPHIEPGVPTSVHLDLRLPVDISEEGAVDVFALGAHLAGEAIGCLGLCYPDLDPQCLLDIDNVVALCSDKCITLEAIYNMLDCPVPTTVQQKLNMYFDCGLDSRCYLKKGYISMECIAPLTTCLLTCADSDSLKSCGDDDCVTECGTQLIADGLGHLDVSVTAYDEYGTKIDEFDPPGFQFSNNINDIEITILPPQEPAPSQGPVQFETSFQKGFTSKYANVGIQATAIAGMDKMAGASASIEASVPVKLFGTSFEFFGFKSLGKAYPGELGTSVLDPEKNKFTLDLYFLGEPILPIIEKVECVVGQKDEFYKWQLGGLDCTKTCDPSLPKDHPDYQERELERANCLKGCGAFGKSNKVVKDFVVAAVPLTASFEAWGLIGAEAVIELPACDSSHTPFKAYAGPWLDIGSDVSAGVGSSKVFAVGVGGEASLISDTFYATVEVQDLKVQSGKLSGILHEDITNTLTGPNGQLYWYVGYPCIKVCRKWGVPYPCGTKQCKSKDTICSFKTFEKKDVLFCEEQSVDISIN